MWPQQLLEMWSIDQTTTGATLWLELCWQIWRGRTPAQAVREMVQRTGWTHGRIYGEMKQALQPLLEADSETLEALGLRLKERTTPQLAAAVARTMGR